MSRTFVIYVIDFDLIGISTCLTLLNDHQNLNFVKYIYVAGKKRPEIVVNWPYAKVVCFFGIQSLCSANVTVPDPKIVIRANPSPKARQ